MLFRQKVKFSEKLLLEITLKLHQPKTEYFLLKCMEIWNKHGI